MQNNAVQILGYTKDCKIISNPGLRWAQHDNKLDEEKKKGRKVEKKKERKDKKQKQEKK